MNFTLKKIIATLIMPLPIALAAFIVGILLLWCCRKKRWPSLFLCLSLFILLIFSAGPIPSFLMHSLESHYPPLTQPPLTVKSIVVLGGGVRRGVDAPSNTQLSAASLSRLVEGIRLYRFYKRHHKHVRLILSGGRVFGSPADANTMQSTTSFLNVDPTDTVLEAGSRNTAEEAQYLKQQLTHKHFILVTSAYHMPRAMMLFEKQGLHPLPAPTQYITDNKTHPITYYLPNAKYLIMSDIALHEYFGMLWVNLHG